MKSLAVLALAVVAVPSFAQVLWNNGPLATGTTAIDGTVAPAGTQWSQLQDTDTTPQNTVLGYSVNYLSTTAQGPFRQGDDFVVDADAWNVDAITVYGFRTNGNTTESFGTGVVRIWNARPDATGAQVVAGDLTTNRLVSTSFSGLYRIGRANGPTPIRPIMAATLSLPTTLTRGTYWIEYGLALGANNIMSPLVTIPGRIDTPGANAFFYTSQQYFAMTDMNSLTPLAVPFEIRGSAVPEPATLAALGLGAAALLRRRRRA